MQGDVLISPDASGEINLDGVTTIQGRLTIQDCGSGCDSGLTKISSSTLQSVGGGLQIANAKGLKEISFPALREAQGNVSFWDLPALETLDISALDSVEGLDVGAVPQLYYLGLPPAAFGNVNISGNGNLVVGLSNNGDGSNNNSRISTLNASGIGKFQWSGGGEGNNVGALAVHDSSDLETLPLLFQTVQRLEVRDNGALSELAFPQRPEAQSLLVSRLRDIAITGNARLNLTTAHDVAWGGGDTATTSWVWPGEDMDTVVLDGVVHGAFFQPLVDAHQGTSLANQNQSRPRVLVDFRVTSSVPGFLCGPLDGMRRRGVFPGGYSCNGNSIDIPSGASRSAVLGTPGAGAAALAALAVGMAVGLFGLA